MTPAECPFCRHRKIVASGQRAFFCPLCKATFEPDEEGIDPTITANPSRRMEREEARQERERQRTNRSNRNYRGRS